MPALPSPLPFLNDLLNLAAARGATAVYLMPGAPPSLRVDDRLVKVSPAVFTPEHVAALAHALMNEAQLARWIASRDLDFTVDLGAVGRWRASAFFRRDQPAMVLRPMVRDMPTIDSLGLPAVLGAVALAATGLVLIASGSPAIRHEAMAALVDHRTRHGFGAIVLVGDDTPFEHVASRCEIHRVDHAGSAWRWVQEHATDSAPVAVVLDSLRGRTAVERALHIARSALCIAPVSARDVAQALARLLPQETFGGDDVLPRHFADQLRAAVGLRQLQTLDGKRHVVAAEVLVASPLVAAQLADGSFEALGSVMRTSRELGMQTLDQHLFELYEAGAVAYEDALRNAQSVNDLRLSIKLNSQRARSKDLSAGIDHLAIVGGEPHAPAPLKLNPFVAPAPPSDSATADPFAEDPWDDFGDLPTAGGEASRPPTASSLDDPFDAVDTERTGIKPGPLGPPDRVQFRAFAPERIAPGATVLVDIWACLPAQAAEVASLAASTAAHWQAGLRAGVSVQRGSMVTVRLQIDALQVDPAVQVLDWQGEPVNASFVVAAPVDARIGAHGARAWLLVNAVPIGELTFLLNVATVPAEPNFVDAGASSIAYRSAFASFASEDRAEMLARVQGMKTVAPDLDIFIDALSLRAGERWQQRIDQEVAARQRLLLFWSPHAAESKWVDYEWRAAARLKGLDAIDPVPLADPRLANPPGELQALHFNDVYLAHIESERRFTKA
jgi:twitching motility protein PilU